MWMHRGRCLVAWDHTCTIYAGLLNSRMGVKKGDLVGADEFHPIRSRGKRRRGDPQIVPITALKALFVDKKR
jgi:hypothetical protein